jgi:hypothetical protein
LEKRLSWLGAAKDAIKLLAEPASKTVQFTFRPGGHRPMGRAGAKRKHQQLDVDQFRSSLSPDPPSSSCDSRLELLVKTLLANGETVDAENAMEDEAASDGAIAESATTATRPAWAWAKVGGPSVVSTWEFRNC